MISDVSQLLSDLNNPYAIIYSTGPDVLTEATFPVEQGRTSSNDVLVIAKGQCFMTNRYLVWGWGMYTALEFTLPPFSFKALNTISLLNLLFILWPGLFVSYERTLSSCIAAACAHTRGRATGTWIGDDNPAWDKSN